MPGNLSRADALKSRGMEAVRLIVGCVPLLVVAGIIEGFVSPQLIPHAIKIGIGVITGITLYSYLFLAGREKHNALAGPNQR
jgi:purine-cytosine permease-like protein